MHLDDKQNIAHVVFSGLGGTTDYIFNLIKGDTKKKYLHHIFFFGIEDLQDDTLKTAKEIASSVHITKKSRGIDRKAYRRISLAITALHPLAITCHVNSLILPLSIAFKHICPIIFVEHQANHLKSRKEKLWSIMAQKRAKFVISLTEEYQINLVKLVKRFYRTEKNVIIKSGIVLDEYKKIKNQSGILRIGMVSRINDFRDHETLLKAFKSLEVENISLHIAGDGPLKEKLESRFQANNISWHGTLNQMEIREFLSGLDLYVHASKGETSSMALMQAMASSLPIVASDVEGISNVFKNGNGVLVEVNNSNALKNAIQELILNQEKRDELANKSNEYALTNCDHKVMFNQYDKLL